MSATLRIQEEAGPLTKSEAVEWTKAQLHFPNLAGDQDVAQRAINHQKQVVKQFTEKMVPMHRRWRLTYYMLTGNTIDRLGPEDIHIPELYKQIETMVPRMEGAILDQDPWFRVRGREQMDQREADTIAAFIDWELDQCKFRDLVQPAIRDLLVTQVAIFHYKWKRKVEERVIRERTSETDPKTGKTTITYKAKEVEEVVYDGPDVELVDPFDFIIDTRATDSQKAMYVGHRSWVSYDELLQYQEQGLIENVEQLKDDKPDSTLDPLNQWNKWSRSPTERWGRPTEYKTAGMPKMVEVVTLWSKFELEKTGKFTESVTMVGNGKVCLQARKNYHDKKFRPYATSRAARNGHEFFGTGVLDNAVRLNQYLDRYNAIFLRSAALIANPILTVADGGDLPDSLYRVTPGRVYKGVEGVNQLKIQNTLDSAPFVLGTVQRHIEETVGSFRINMGQDSGGTATEASLSLQEGNRRNQGITRNLIDMFDQLLRGMHLLNGQFATRKQAFRVLGKRAKDVEADYLEVGPDSLMADIDFEFVGLSNLQSYGMRATMLQNIVNTTMPLIVQSGGRVNSLEIIHDLIELMIGPDEADRIVKVPTSPDRRMPQEQENEMLRYGQKVKIDPDDNHDQHLKVLDPLLKKALAKGSGMEMRERIAVIQHATDHRHEADKKKALLASQEQESQLYPKPGDLQPPEAGGPPQQQQGQAPQPGGLSAALGGSTPAQTPAGQNPGPMSGGKIGRAGGARAPINQTEDDAA